MFKIFKKSFINYMEELNDKDSNLIFSFINGELTDAEKELFDKRCKEDISFCAEVEAYKDAKLAAFMVGQSNIKDILKEEAAKYQEQQNKIIQSPAKVVSLNTWLLRGVAAIFLFGTCWWAFQYFTTPKYDSNQLFIQNFKDFEDLPITRYRSDNVLKIDENFSHRHDSVTIKQSIVALDFYAQKNYKSSIQSLEQIKVIDDTLSLCKAVAYISMDKTLESEIILKKLIQKGNGFTKAYAEWYLALLYLKNEKIAESRVLLSKIQSESSHPFYSTSKDLLKELSK
jgi:hypothetical protein